jgi:hypothetical protein
MVSPAKKADSFGSAPPPEIIGRKNAKNPGNLKKPLLPCQEFWTQTDPVHEELHEGVGQ